MSSPSPGCKRRPSGETRLDRLVRRPSAEGRVREGPKAREGPKLPKPRRTNCVKEEPLYDRVASDEPEQEDE